MHDLHFAVVVGIDEYPGIRNLHSAQRDAKAFRDWLIDASGGNLPSANVELILETGPFRTTDEAKPTRDAVNRAFKKIHGTMRQQFLRDALSWEKSRLYVYFSGHGVTPKPQEVAVLMADATEDDLGYNIACGMYMNYYLASQDFHELVFFADCCRTFKGNAPLSLPPFNVVNNNRGQVIGVLGFATQYQNVAYEPEASDAGRGYYTQALLEGLRGAAIDRTLFNRGEINSSSLQSYVRERVKELTKNKPVPQVSDMVADPAAKVIFRIGAVQPLRTVTITFPAGFARTVVLSDGKLPSMGEWEPAQGDWVMQLEDGNYEVRPKDAADGQEFSNNGLFKLVGGSRNVEL